MRDIPLSIDDPRIVRAIELVWREAALLDGKEYEAWKALYTDDALYVIPIDRNVIDFQNHLNMVYDNKRMRELRVTRMTEGYAIAAVDAATTVRTVSRFVPVRIEADLVELRAAQVVVAYKRGTHDLRAGDVDYKVRLGAVAADDRIAGKVIRLVDSDAVVPASGYLL